MTNIEDTLRAIAKIAVEISNANSKDEVFLAIDKVLKLTENIPTFATMNKNLVNLKQEYECSRPLEGNVC